MVWYLGGKFTLRLRKVTTSPNFWSAERICLLSVRERGIGVVVMWIDCAATRAAILNFWLVAFSLLGIGFSFLGVVVVVGLGIEGVELRENN